MEPICSHQAMYLHLFAQNRTEYLPSDRLTGRLSCILNHRYSRFSSEHETSPHLNGRPLSAPFFWRWRLMQCRKLIEFIGARNDVSLGRVSSFTLYLSASSSYRLARSARIQRSSRSLHRRALFRVIPNLFRMSRISRSQNPSSPSSAALIRCVL